MLLIIIAIGALDNGARRGMPAYLCLLLAESKDLAERCHLETRAEWKE